MSTLLTAVALLPCLAPPAPQEPAPAVRELLAFDSAGCEALFLDAKDAELHRALHLLEERLGELPAELGTGVSPDSMQLPLRLLYGRSALRVSLDGGAHARGAFPVLAQLELPEADSAAAEALTIRATDFLMDVAPMLRKDIEPSGLYRFNTGPVDVMYGAVDSTYVVSLGAPRPAQPLGPSELPAGVAPAMRMRLDLGALLDMLGPLLRNSSGGSLDAKSLFAGANVQISSDFGVGTDRAYSVSRTRGYRTALEATSGMPEHMLSADALRVIPADAVWAMGGVTNFEGALDAAVESFEQALGSQDPFNGEDPLDALAGLLGLHLRDDLAANLGAHWGAYFSDSTGGGGMASLVMFVELANAEGLEAGFARVEGIVNSLGAMQARGYVRIDRRPYGEQELWSLSFPGMPIPLELSMGVAAGHLFVGMTPQAALAGMRHVVQGSPSLLDDPEFQRCAPELRGDELGFSFLDTAELLADGYGPATLFASALSNGVRSPVDGARQPGLILPPFADLARGVRPTVSMARLVGDDLVATAEMDRSMLVNTVAALGWMERLPLAELFALAGIAGLAEQANAMEEAARASGFGR